MILTFEIDFEEYLTGSPNHISSIHEANPEGNGGNTFDEAV
jgi:hypothetical protein